jgi:predicted HAD superfamily Cof-like phosphohydrolase
MSNVDCLCSLETQNPSHGLQPVGIECDNIANGKWFNIQNLSPWNDTITKVRLIAKKKQMSNPFRDQEKFMRACDQSVGEFNEAQYQLYCNLISEEFNELVASDNKVDDLDALIDILVVTVGAIHSLGADAEGAWKEVMRTNFAKIDHETGKVRKREDGKVLKPLGWTPPELEQFVK